MTKKTLKAELVSRFYRGNHCALFTGLAASILASSIGLIASWFIKAFVDVITKEENALSNRELITALILFLIYFLVTFILKATSEPEFIRRGMKQYKDYAFDMLTSKGIASFKIHLLIFPLLPTTVLPSRITTSHRSSISSPRS